MKTFFQRRQTNVPSVVTGGSKPVQNGKGNAEVAFRSRILGYLNNFFCFLKFFRFTAKQMTSTTLAANAYDEDEDDDDFGPINNNGVGKSTGGAPAGLVI